MAENLAKPFRPMLASPVNLRTLRFPSLASYKLDGIRVTVHPSPNDGRSTLMSRSMKPIPSRYLQAWAHRHHNSLLGADGELIVGAPNDPLTFSRTTSHVMADDKADFGFTYHVFDCHDRPQARYLQRLAAIADAVKSIPNVVLHGFTVVESIAELEAFEAGALDQGYEGVMLRDPCGFYKQGRSTAMEQGLLKMKRYLDMEGVVLAMRERMHNGNEKFTNEIGRGARSSHRSGKTGLGTLGALVVRGLNGPFKGVVFSVAAGFDDAERARIWAGWGKWIGAETELIAKIKFVASGAKDAPRHPVFVGFRDPIDMG